MIKHYEGILGNFDYDTEVWELDEDESSLHYIGDSEKVVLPEGCTSCRRMFEGLSSVRKLDLSDFDTSEVTDMAYMFYRCDILKELDGTYDFIFMDAAKGQYINFLPELLRLMPAGGLLISDNVLQEGDIVESRYGVTRRNRTIHTRMREYIYTLTHAEQLETSIVPIGDGITLSVKKG